MGTCYSASFYDRYSSCWRKDYVHLPMRSYKLTVFLVINNMNELQFFLLHPLANLRSACPARKQWHSLNFLLLLRLLLFLRNLFSFVAHNSYNRFSRIFFSIISDRSGFEFNFVGMFFFFSAGGQPSTVVRCTR